MTNPVGPDVPGWTPRPRPGAVTLRGRWAAVEPLSVTHAADLFAAHSTGVGTDLTYMRHERPATLEEIRAHIAAATAGADRFFAVIDPSGRAVGSLSLLNAVPEHGSVEVGWIEFSPLMARSRMGTQVHELLMTYCFDELGYRRYEWKCDSLNAPSRRAAERLGFTFEGIFRNAVVYKGRSRDTAWLSITDAEWPAVRAGLRAWLAPENFDADGAQLATLEELRAR